MKIFQNVTQKYITLADETSICHVATTVDNCITITINENDTLIAGPQIRLNIAQSQALAHFVKVWADKKHELSAELDATITEELRNSPRSIVK